MRKIITSTLLALSVLSSSVMADEIRQPFTDDMAIAMGLTPIEEINANRTVVKNDARITPLLLVENKIVIVINKAAKGPGAQTLTMYEDGVQVLQTKVSTGKEERVTSTSGRTYVSTTPLGFYRPTKVYFDYLSYTWDAPMPNSVFFIGGIAIHATGQSNYSKLGTRASGGCVRTKLEESKIIREAVMNSGRGVAPGLYTLKTESRGRTIVANNTVAVSGISRSTGARTGVQMQSWDTIIYVHE